MAANIRDNSKAEKSMDKALIYGQTAAIIQGHGNRTNCLAMDSINGSLAGHIRDNGLITKCMEKVCIYGKMAVGMKDSTIMTINTVQGSTSGLMGRSFKASGLMESERARENTTERLE